MAAVKCRASENAERHKQKDGETESRTNDLAYCGIAALCVASGGKYLLLKQPRAFSFSLADPLTRGSVTEPRWDHSPPDSQLPSQWLIFIFPHKPIGCLEKSAA